MSVSDPSADDLLRQAIAIGENMIRIADVIGQPVAGNYFSIGLDILRRAAADAASTSSPVQEAVKEIVGPQISER